MQELEARINLVHSLKRKCGSTIPEIIRLCGEGREKLRQLEERDEELVRLNAELQHLNETLRSAGQQLSRKRRQIIPKLQKAVAGQLEALGFKQSRFEIDVQTQPKPDPLKSAPSSSGLDTIEFQFAPNPGEPARPLRSIASSGEMARVMLALKTVLAAEDEIPVLIFDEVDANVGGETAEAVGDKMRQIGQRRQVLCITHLAPVAAGAAAHYRVSKQVQDGRTLTEIQLLDKSARIEELARMLGGTGEAARQHAESLLKPIGNSTRQETGATQDRSPGKNPADRNLQAGKKRRS
jgi:DNA repair protein RecN (Recombination protein N)